MERVHSCIEILLGDGEDISTILGELISEEHVSEVDLTKHVDEVEYLTGEELHEVGSTSGVSKIGLITKLKNILKKTKIHA